MRLAVRIKSQIMVNPIRTVSQQKKEYVPVDFKIWKVCVENLLLIDAICIHQSGLWPTHKKWMSRHLEFLTH